VKTISKSQSLNFGEHKRLHPESSKQNYCIISLRAIIKAIFTQLAFWLLCGMHAVIQDLPDGVGSSRNRRYHVFAALAVDVTVFFNRETGSALTSGFSRSPAQPTPCSLHLAYFD